MWSVAAKKDIYVYIQIPINTDEQRCLYTVYYVELTICYKAIKQRSVPESHCSQQ